MVLSPQLKSRDQCTRKRKTTTRDHKMILQNTFKAGVLPAQRDQGAKLKTGEGKVLTINYCSILRVK